MARDFNKYAAFIQALENEVLYSSKGAADALAYEDWPPHLIEQGGSTASVRKAARASLNQRANKYFSGWDGLVVEDSGREARSFFGWRWKLSLGNVFFLAEEWEELLRLEREKKAHAKEEEKRQAEAASQHIEEEKRKQMETVEALVAGARLSWQKEHQAEIVEARRGALIKVEIMEEERDRLFQNISEAQQRLGILETKLETQREGHVLRLERERTRGRVNAEKLEQKHKRVAAALGAELARLRNELDKTILEKRRNENVWQKRIERSDSENSVMVALLGAALTRIERKGVELNVEKQKHYGLQRRYHRDKTRLSLFKMGLVFLGSLLVIRELLVFI